MKFDLGLNLCGNCLLRKDISEVTREIVRVYLFDLTSRKLDQARKTLNISICSSNSNEIDHNSAFFSEFSNLIVDLLGTGTTVVA